MAEDEKGKNFFKFAAQFIRFPSFKALGEMTRPQMYYLLKSIDLVNETETPEPQLEEDTSRQNWRDKTLKNLTNMIDSKNKEMFG